MDVLVSNGKGEEVVEWLESMHQLCLTLVATRPAMPSDLCMHTSIAFAVLMVCYLQLLLRYPTASIWCSDHAFSFADMQEKIFFH